ncbi:MAG: MepB family protein [Flavobacteriaceae bacterium]|nr:MAG: MepB family protein [Flavobacteriaceae bacterium]
MDNKTNFIKQQITSISSLTNTQFSEITAFNIEKESQKYQACNFKIKEEQFICRLAFTTPKKIGQFVTFWKRDLQNQTAPFNELDTFDHFLIISKSDENSGYFKFPKSILIEKGIISSEQKAGKRGFRVYPPWDIALNKQAIKTQQWQLKFFYTKN